MTTASPAAVEEAYDAFMAMPEDEWSAMLDGGTAGLRPAEHVALARARAERDGSATGAELVEVEPYELVNVETGERLPATIENVPVVLAAARAMKERLQDVIAMATDVALEASRVQGTKTLRTEHGNVVLSGGAMVEYDATSLAQLLREAGCPEERIDRVVKAEITYKVDRSVLRQLTASNEDYKAAAELAAVEVMKPYRASVRA